MTLSLICTKNAKNLHFLTKCTCIYPKNVVILRRICKIDFTINNNINF